MEMNIFAYWLKISKWPVLKIRLTLKSICIFVFFSLLVGYGQIHVAQLGCYD